jgi:hypothetical protein
MIIKSATRLAFVAGCLTAIRARHGQDDNGVRVGGCHSADHCVLAPWQREVREVKANAKAMATSDRRASKPLPPGSALAFGARRGAFARSVSARSPPRWRGFSFWRRGRFTPVVPNADLAQKRRDLCVRKYRGRLIEGRQGRNNLCWRLD